MSLLGLFLLNGQKEFTNQIYRHDLFLKFVFRWMKKNHYNELLNLGSFDVFFKVHREILSDLLGELQRFGVV